MIYDRQIGERIRVSYHRDFGDGSCVTVHLRPGWNNGVPWQECPMSVEELRGLRYLADRAIAYAEQQA